MNWKDAWICVDEMDYFLFSVGLVFSFVFWVICWDLGFQLRLDFFGRLLVFDMLG